MKNCVVCKKPDGKYKCPMCLVYYCSVSCCNEHRKSKCKLVEEKPPEQAHSDTNKKYEFQTVDTVPVKKLKLLEHDKDLKNLLINPHLRNLLTIIDKSNKPDEIMQKAMMEPIFVEFSDACLNIVEPKEEGEI